MNPLCTSFAFAPRRIARCRAARWLVGVLAIVLIAANVAVAAMPDSSGAAVVHHDVATAGHGSPHAHCVGHADPAQKHAGHGYDCGCCGKACACAQACDTVTAVALKTSIASSPHAFHKNAPRVYAAIERRLLRPPIG